jgi:hypothetical protein
MKKIFITIASFFLIGCAQNSSKKDQTKISTINRDSTILYIQKENQEIKINYNEIEEFIHPYGLYEFNAPKGLFKKCTKDEFKCELFDAKIKFTFIIEYFSDGNGIFNKKDLINKYKSEIKTTYSLDKRDWFVLSGNDSKNNIIYLKGFYEEHKSMCGREQGEPLWLWSKAGILEIQYPKIYKKEFDNLIPIIIKSYKCDFSAASF